MARSPAGLQVSVNSRADIILGVAVEGSRCTVSLDMAAAEKLIEALAGACAAAREVHELGYAADAAAEQGVTGQEGERAL